MRRRRHLVIAAVAAVAAAVTGVTAAAEVRAQPGDLAVPSRAARRLRGDPRGRPAQYLGAVVKRVHEGPGTRRQGGVSSARGFPPRGYRVHGTPGYVLRPGDAINVLVGVRHRLARPARSRATRWEVRYLVDGDERVVVVDWPLTLCLPGACAGF